MEKRYFFRRIIVCWLSKHRFSIRIIIFLQRRAYKVKVNFPIVFRQSTIATVFRFLRFRRKILRKGVRSILNLIFPPFFQFVPTFSFLRNCEACRRPCQRDRVINVLKTFHHQEVGSHGSGKSFIACQTKRDWNKGWGVILAGLTRRTTTVVDVWPPLFEIKIKSRLVSS